ncbi:Eco57I restriction-modification methylase domain-containing protein [Campylobacter upsaliensis]|uniref:Eco57I restriction-modification methylase domain-containing protein n=1 Tax=Campylobacter upsaliensis TaxID=28080 RepID=UPI002149D102|nr:SNF2-related protein [Campylobacter upsaliensis]MCR2112209.1 SNF2-related protein [Campylobacter upsaliensis]
MQILLILSNDKSLSHIGIIAKFSDELNQILKNQANNIQNDFNSLKEYMLSSMLTNSFYAQIGDKPDFNDIIEENNISFILNLTQISSKQALLNFSIKEDNNFTHYDFKNFIQDYSYEDFVNILAFINQNDNLEFTQGESSVTNPNSNENHQSARSEDNTREHGTRMGASFFSEKAIDSPTFENRGNEIQAKNQQNDPNSYLEIPSNEFHANEAFLQTAPAHKQREDGGTLQELGQFDDRDGFINKSQTAKPRRDRKENSHFQRGANTSLTGNKTPKEQGGLNKFSYPRGEKFEINRARYDTSKLRARIDALFQSSLTRSFMEENILSSFELFRGQTPFEEYSNINANRGSDSEDRRAKMGANSHTGEADTELNTAERESTGFNPKARGDGRADENKNREFERFAGEFRTGDEKSARLSHRKFDEEREGEFSKRNENEATNFTSFLQSPRETKEFSSPVSKELSDTTNDSHQISLKKTESNAKNEKRDFSTAINESNHSNAQSSPNAEQQELRNENGELFSLDDSRISISPKSKEDTANKEFSQSKTYLSQVQESFTNANEQGESTNANQEPSPSVNDEANKDNVEFLKTLSDAIIKEALRQFKEDDEAYEKLKNKPNEKEFFPLLEPSEFKIFTQHQFLKKLDGENYKGKVDFKLTFKERIKANYEALKLTQNIFHQNRLVATAKEQEVLAKFSGYGGLKALFYDDKYEKEKDELLKLVGVKYFKELRDSSVSAFYTPSFIVNAMYERLLKLGLSQNEKVKVLEPSCGVGIFMSLAPENFEFEAVEKDSLTATIAKFLHPKVVIYNKGLEEVKFNKEFDLVVGNPPYAKESIYDVSSKGHKENVHNYFAIKCAELLKENGLFSFVISSYFLDSQSAKHREILKDMGTLVDSYRLSSEAFYNTEVISDLIFYAKRKFKGGELDYKAERISENFTKSVVLYDETMQDSPHYSAIYKEDMQNHLGSLELSTNQFGVCLSIKNKYIEQSLKDAIDRADTLLAFKNNPPYESKDLKLIDYDILSQKEQNIIKKLKNGNMFLLGNKIYIKQEDNYCEEAYFEDSLPLSKKYLIEPSLIIAEQKKNFTYKSYLNEDEIKIATLLCELRDKLEDLLFSERFLDDSLNSNEAIMIKKEELRILREKILNTANLKSLNQSNQKVRDKDDKVIMHSFKDILFLDKLASYELLALEEKDGKNYTLAPIFYERITKPFVKTLANNEEEALMKTLSEKGKIDLVTLQSYLPSKSLEQILYTLLEKRLIFHSIKPKQELKVEFEPTQELVKAYEGVYELSEQFLSGNVKKKHAQIKTMLENKESFRGLSQPLDEILLDLEKAFPAYVHYEDIHINFGSSFIDLTIYEKFIEDNFFNKKAYVKLALIDGAFYLRDFCVESESLNDNGDIEIDFKEAEFSDLSQMATNFIIYDENNEIYFTPQEFLQKVLNNKNIEVFHYEPHPNGELNSKGEIKRIKVNEPTATKIALEKKEELMEAFESYLLNHKDYRAKIEKDYNDKINVYAINKNSYSKFFSSPTLSKDINLREHQKNVAFKGIIENSLLLDHQVGGGKTLAGACIVMEQLRMNLVQKALILVPNHLTNQWQNEIKKAYPNAKLLVGDKISDKKDRKEFLHRIKYGNYEAVIMKHSTFENLNVLASYERAVYYDYIENLKKSLTNSHEEYIKNNNLSSKELSKSERKLRESIERKIKSLEKKLERKARGKEFDDEFAFEQLGFDLVMVDEAHHFKNLFINTNQDNIRGLNTADSAKAMKMYCVSQFLHENNHKLYFLTGTPVSNSIAEFFVMQKYLQPQVLEDLGLSHFDDWQKTFTQIVDSEELDSSGINYKIVSRLSKFINAPELMATYMQNADVVSIEDIEKLTGKLTPNLKDGKVINVIAPRSEEIASYIGIENEKGEYNKGSIIWRMDNLRDDPKNNNMLKCTSDARKAALDFRLIEPLASDYEESKINQMCKRIFHHYQDENYPNNTQLVFCDMGISKKNSQSIDVSKEEVSTLKSLENLKEELGLVLEYDEDKEENFYAQYKYEDEEGNKLKKPKLVKKYDVEELLELCGNAFDVYADILKKLVRFGIKQDEIAFIGDATTDKQKQDLFDKVNEGKIRILIGSTMKMGAGTNVQKKNVALHELDCPWRPCDLEQRQGRVIRQGNEWFEKDKNFCIAHYRYSTEQTYDARMFQVNEQKLKPLAQLKKCDFSKGVREFESIDGEIASVAEMKAYATGNPFILEKHKITTMLKSEQRHYEAYKKSILQNERDLQSLEQRQIHLTKEQDALREMAHNKDFEKENYQIKAFEITINKKEEIKKDKDETKALKKAHQAQKEKINEKIKEIFLKPKAEEEFLTIKANGVSLIFKGHFSLDNKFVYQGELRFDTGQSYQPSNLIFVSSAGAMFYTIPELDGLLERIKNSFKKANDNLNKTNTLLKNTEAEIKMKEDFLSQNQLHNYPRKKLLDTLKRDEKNINEIFVIRNNLRKKSIKLEMDSEEIKHLLPKYTHFFNEKGKFNANLASEILEQKSTSEEAKELKNAVLSLENVEIKFNALNEKDSLKDKINTLLANQENISRASRAKDILK